MSDIEILDVLMNCKIIDIQTSSEMANPTVVNNCSRKMIYFILVPTQDGKCKASTAATRGIQIFLQE